MKSSTPQIFSLIKDVSKLLQSIILLAPFIKKKVVEIDIEYERVLN